MYPLTKLEWDLILNMLDTEHDRALLVSDDERAKDIAVMITKIEDALDNITNQSQGEMDVEDIHLEQVFYA